jgi:hypothetical protein
MASANHKPFGKVLAYGAVSTLLYALLYFFGDEILRWTTRGGWFFVLPVAIAFLFSFFHGGFTGYFWEVLGVQARTKGAKK